MNQNIPRTPFSTALSGSAKETERRIRNIFSGPKKRPPLPFLALVFAACLLCGNLVSCNVAESESDGNPAQLDNPQAGSASLETATPAWVTYMHGETPLSEEEQTLRENLFRAAERQNGYQFQVPTVQLLNTMEKDGWLLGVVFVEDYWENTLILGIMNKETGEVPHAVFQCSHHIGVPNVVTFQNNNGEDCLLYTFNGQENGQYTGEAGVVRLDGTFLTWEWPVEGDAGLVNDPPVGPKGTFSEYEDYWNSHLALLAPGGVDIYTVNPDFEWGQDKPVSMWQLDHGETFWYDSSSAEELPMPVYFQSLQWLNEHAEPDAGWRILSLFLNEERCDPENQMDCYTLWAGTDDVQNQLTADLFFPYDLTGNRKSYDNLALYDTHTYQTSPGERVEP